MDCEDSVARPTLSPRGVRLRMACAITWGDITSDREVLLLRAAGELSLDEIATVTRSSVAAVKMRLHRARSRLTQLLEEASHAR